MTNSKSRSKVFLFFYALIVIPLSFLFLGTTITFVSICLFAFIQYYFFKNSGRAFYIINLFWIFLVCFCLFSSIRFTDESDLIETKNKTSTVFTNQTLECLDFVESFKNVDATLLQKLHDVFDNDRHMSFIPKDIFLPNDSAWKKLSDCTYFDFSKGLKKDVLGNKVFALKTMLFIKMAQLYNLLKDNKFEDFTVETRSFFRVVNNLATASGDKLFSQHLFVFSAEQFFKRVAPELLHINDLAFIEQVEDLFLQVSIDRKFLEYAFEEEFKRLDLFFSKTHYKLIDEKLSKFKVFRFYDFLGERAFYKWYDPYRVSLDIKKYQKKVSSWYLGQANFLYKNPLFEKSLSWYDLLKIFAMPNSYARFSLISAMPDFLQTAQRFESYIMGRDLFLQALFIKNYQLKNNKLPEALEDPNLRIVTSDYLSSIKYSKNEQRIFLSDLKNPYAESYEFIFKL